MSAPTVSVILPCFDRLRFLRQAVASVLAQTHSQFELIVADDGSGVEVQGYLRELGAEPRVRVLRQTHSGNPAAVRNAGLRQASGQYVAFIDSDDVWLPRKLELQLASLQRREECRWGYTAYDYIDAADQVTASNLTGWVPHEGQALESSVRLCLMSALPSVISERALLEEVGGFDATQHFYEDHDLWFRLALRSNADVVPKVLLHIRKHDEHYSNTNRLAAAECKAELLKRMLANVEDPSLRQIIRRQRAVSAATLLRLYLAAPAGRSRAIQSLLGSAPYSWPYAAWWASALRTVAPWPVSGRRAARSGSIES